MRRKTVAAWLTASAVLYSLYFWGMSGRGLIGPDEPRYAAIAREMAVSGDWVTPSLDGEPWFEKPALLYWMGAAAARLGFDDDRATRLPVALLSVGFLIYFYLALASSFGRNAAVLATMILGTSVGWVAFSHAGIFDLPLAVTVSVALISLLPWIEQAERSERPPPLIFGGFLGLSVLAKGLAGPAVAALALLPLLAEAGLRDRILSLARPRTLLAFAAVSLPWYALCYFQNGSVFVEDFIWKHHVMRFVSSELQHVQPVWYFVPVLLGALLPWTPLLGLLPRLAIGGDTRLRFLAGWAATTFLFFSLSVNKLPAYILPALPPLAGLMGVGLAKARRPVILLTSAALLLMLVPIGAALAPEAMSHGLRRAWPPTDVSWFWVASVLLAAAGAAIAAARGTTASASAVAAAAAVSLVLLKIAAVPEIDRQAGTRSLWQQIKPRHEATCLGDVRRHVVYGLRYYSTGRLPDCSTEPRPFRVESDPPRIVPAGTASSP